MRQRVSDRSGKPGALTPGPSPKERGAKRHMCFRRGLAADSATRPHLGRGTPKNIN